MANRNNSDITDQRAIVCSIARTWLKTPYHHMGRVKGVGADCAMFPLEVYREAGLMPEIEVPYYPQDWHLHKSEEIYLGIVEQHAAELNITLTPQPGDFVLFHFGRTWSHGGIVLEWPLMIHSVVGIGVVLGDGERDGKMVGRKKRFFTLPQFHDRDSAPRS